MDEVGSYSLRLRKARKDDKEGVSGTVLLIREGAPDQDLGYFFKCHYGTKIRGVFLPPLKITE